MRRLSDTVFHTFRIHQNGGTALMAAAINGHEAVAQLLLTAGAAKDLQNNVSVKKKTASMCSI